jgi:aminoglycoside phosphotransferase (APT) family kinase protein
MRPPGEVIASGRDADIFDYGPGRVLRRSRVGRSMENEARIMEFVRARGFPVPEVLEVGSDGRDLVMERIDGPTMVETCTTQPWRIRRMGTELAELHQRLHLLVAPEWLREAPCGQGSQVVHLDLHPLNVLMTDEGPVVIDWTNAARGDPGVDVALAWVLIASGEVPGNRLEALLATVGRKILLRGFLEPFVTDDLRAVLGQVVEWKCTDPHMSPIEQRRMRSLL